MNLTFVINDIDIKYLEYEHTGILRSVDRRAVEIELTEEQVRQIGLKQLGMNCGKPVMEIIESVSVSLNNQEP